MNKFIAIILLIITTAACMRSWVRFMANYEDYIGLDSELRLYTPMK